MKLASAFTCPNAINFDDLTALLDVDAEHAGRRRGSNENDAVVRIQPVVSDVARRRRLHPVRRFNLQ